ncbi:uncharacterized protein C8A04DRAFT_36519 [Dichotomopilus funicola]|uniref:Uncharacterized protein n=1 Tax=Dichotomopilus funicola TaxID=1934379 RepID=A0AAN6V4B4_9PEZI|nr:hypothetical protein C8A04DRAFT_36519 [Dichotomopilus funicola]
MPLWPFRRGTRRKRGRATTTDNDERGATAIAVNPNGHAPERQSSKRQRTGSNKLYRRPRAYSFSPGREDSVQVGRKRIIGGQRDGDTPMPDAGNDTRIDEYGVDAVRDNMLWRVPTLHGKKDGDRPLRKLSSKKRRRDDRQREAEIKAMSAFAPVRPAAEDWTAGRPMRKDTKRYRPGFGGGDVKGSELERYNRSSDISLPLAESIDSALSSDSDYISYKVSAFESLSPRPTLRYTTNPRAGPHVQGSTGVARSPSQFQTRLTEPIPEATLKAHKRVDNLADDLSASDLRELMERDQRRRARRKQLEQEKLEQRLARRAEKQKAVEAEAIKHGRESPPNLERGVFGRETAGLGVDPASAVVTSSRIRNTPSPEYNGESAELDGDNLEPCEATDRPGPVATFHRVDSHPLPPLETLPDINEDTPVLATPVSKGSLRRKFSRSKSPQQSTTRTDWSEQPSKPLDGSITKSPRAWTSLFRWASKRRRHSRGPPSFSNTSRDSMQTSPTPALTITPTPLHLGAGVPKRTMSRFREDLPEFPISPPASRVQSPEAETHPAPAVIRTDIPPVAETAASSPSTFRPKHDSHISESPSEDRMQQTPSTLSHTTGPGISPEPQAMSLASIDSEGSWFGGGLGKKRKSSGIMEHGPSLQSSRRTPESDHSNLPISENPNDDVYIANDDYLSRLAPPHGDRSALNRKSTGEARPSSDWGEEVPHWGSVEGQQPTVVRSQAFDRIKSREGLLRSFDEEGVEGTEGESDASDNVGLQRATSIDYGKAHARRISAGSARLLSISPRSSVDAKTATLHSGMDA